MNKAEVCITLSDLTLKFLRYFDSDRNRAFCHLPSVGIPTNKVLSLYKLELKVRSFPFYNSHSKLLITSSHFESTSIKINNCPQSSEIFQPYAYFEIGI